MTAPRKRKSAPGQEGAISKTNYTSHDADGAAAVNSKRNDIERRAVARLYSQPHRIGELDSTWIENPKLREAARYIRLMNRDPEAEWPGAVTPVLELLGEVQAEHHLDDPTALSGYLEELKKGKLPSPRFFNDLQEPDFVMPEILIDGIVHRGGKVLFSGPSKGRKTWAMIYLLLCIQSGKEWWGFPVVRTKALMIDCELFQAAAYGRARTVAKAAGIWDTTGLAVQSLRGQRGLNLARLRDGIIDFCQENEVGVIGIDPYYRIAAGREENSNNEIAEFLEGVEEIAHATGAAVVLTHHYAKGDSSSKNAIDRMSGAGVFARDPDALIAMTEGKDSTLEEPVFVIEPTIREFKPVEPFGIRWQYPLWRRDNKVSVELKKAAGREKAYDVKDMVELIGDEPLSASEWQKECKEQLGMSSASFYNTYYPDARRSGLVTQDKAKRWVKT